jgi:hypothetical protein
MVIDFNRFSARAELIALPILTSMVMPLPPLPKLVQSLLTTMTK